MSWEAIKKHDDEYMVTLCDPHPFTANYVSMPKILNNLVKDTKRCMEEIGLQQRNLDMPIQHHFCWSALSRIFMINWVIGYAILSQIYQ